MKSIAVFEGIGYENVENSEEKIVYVKYTDDAMELPRYKRACIKVFFDLGERTVEIRGRSAKGSLSRSPVNFDVLHAIHAQLIELGWKQGED